jgi:hypothetical protein
LGVGVELAQMNLGQNLANDIDGTTRVLAIANVLREILAEAKLTVAVWVFINRTEGVNDGESYR